MIELIDKMAREIYDGILEGPNKWDSLVINKRKPHTHRLFRMFGDYRVCLHVFDPCKENESFGHPHPWPATFLILNGGYEQYIGESADLWHSVDLFGFKSELSSYTKYEITDPYIWHKIVPWTRTHTLMINGPDFKNKHMLTKTTKGKDLDKLSTPQKLDKLDYFREYLEDYMRFAEL